MKKNIFRILALLMLLCAVLTFAACDKLPFGSKDSGDTSDGGDTTDTPPSDYVDPIENLVLFEDGKAKFQVVFTEHSASGGALVADTFVKRLKTMGALPKDAVAVSDSEASKVQDCEIIIGAEAQNRGDACSVTTKYLGEDGETIKIVGNRVIIATGDPMLLQQRFDTFVRTKLGISNKATSVDETVYVEREYIFEKFTKYLIDSITVNNVDLQNYKLVVDIADAADEKTDKIQAFRENLYSASGYWLDLGEADKVATYDKAFVIRCVDDAGEAGFRAYVEEGGNFIVECAYNNAFNDAFADFATSTITRKTGALSFDSTFRYEDTVSIAYYEDFGAVTSKEKSNICAFEAIYNTHVFANRGGQKVMSKGTTEGYYFYISAKNFTKSIPVKTDVDLNGVTIKIDDVGSDAYANYKLHFFNFERDVKEVVFDDVLLNVPVYATDNNGNVMLDEEGNPVPAYNANGTPKMTTDGIVDDERFQGIKLMNKTAENADDPNVYDNFSWLVAEGLIETQSLIRVTNTLHRDFVRHGANQDKGYARTDVFLVSTDGTISEETPIVYEFDNISKIEIFRTDDEPITFENGNFINICCRTVAETTYTTPAGIKTIYACKWRGYQRTLGIFRTNVTMRNLHHEMEDEPDVGWNPTGSGYKKDNKHQNFGSRHESYPYYGFFYIYNTYNFHAFDSIITGHTVYYEDKPATASTGGSIPDPVPMGTYDLIIEYSSHVYLKNVKQVNSSTPNTGLGDGRYWGIMSSNGARNISFEDCDINRFDAHRGFWNAELTNVNIGHSFQVVGGGTLLAKNVTKITKSNFIMFRGDYGATFNGDIILEDCTMQAFRTYNTARNQKNTTLNNSDRKVETSCVIFDPQYEETNVGWLDDNPSGAYWLWDFGFTSYMPRNITIDNFTYQCENLAAFVPLPDVIFEKTYVEGEPVTATTVKNPYIITESITYKNMNAIPMMFESNFDSNQTYKKMMGIKTTVVNDDEN